MCKHTSMHARRPAPLPSLPSLPQGVFLSSSALCILNPVSHKTLSCLIQVCCLHSIILLGSNYQARAQQYPLPYLDASCLPIGQLPCSVYIMTSNAQVDASIRTFIPHFSVVPRHCCRQGWRLSWLCHGSDLCLSLLEPLHEDMAQVHQSFTITPAPAKPTISLPETLHQHTQFRRSKDKWHNNEWSIRNDHVNDIFTLTWSRNVSTYTTCPSLTHVCSPQAVSRYPSPPSLSLFSILVLRGWSSPLFTSPR